MFRAPLFAVLVSVSALAQERVRVAVHPIVAPGVEDAKLVADLNREAQNILAETKRVTLVATEDVERRLAEEGGKCPARGKERTDCLERVALATRAVYIIAVTVKRLGRDYELSATIADADRVLLEQPEPLTVSDTGAVKIDVALKHQLRALLLDGVKAGALPSDPRMRNPQQPPPVVFVTPPPAENPPPTEAVKPAGISPMRIGAMCAGGVAVAAGVTALVLGVTAQGDAKGLTVVDGVLQDPAQLPTLNASRNKATFAGAMGGVAGAAAVAAVVMFFIPSAEEPAKTTVAPVVLGGNGAGIAVSGRLP